MTRPTTTTNSLGDRYRVWYFGRRYVEVVEARSIGGVPIKRHYFVGLVRKPKILKRTTNRAEAFAYAQKVSER